MRIATSRLLLLWNNNATMQSIFFSTIHQNDPTILNVPLMCYDTANKCISIQKAASWKQFPLPLPLLTTAVVVTLWTQSRRSSLVMKLKKLELLQPDLWRGECWMESNGMGFPDVILWKLMIPSLASPYYSDGGSPRSSGSGAEWVIYMVTAVLSLNRLVPMLLSNP